MPRQPRKRATKKSKGDLDSSFEFQVNHKYSVSDFMESSEESQASEMEAPLENKSRAKSNPVLIRSSLKQAETAEKIEAF